MALGEKLRQARLEKGLSQRQLCGQELTRNMLSQVESGSARPSMDTLQLLARRLGKPVSWFLDEETAQLPNQQVMEQLRQAFDAGDYSLVLSLLEGYEDPDPVYDRERHLLEALSLTALAKTFAQEKPVYARSLLEKAWEAGERTPYFTEADRREWVLTAAMVWEAASELAGRLAADDRELLLRARAALEKENWERSRQLLEAIQSRDPAWQLLSGAAALGQRDYARAAAHYRQAEEAYPRESAVALEHCYREMEDYKLAYYYACKQRE